MIDDKHHRHHHHHHHRGRRGGRPFDYGELRLLVLALIAERPRHGYELMKVIEERMSGRYSPSPGVIYPTLSWLEDMGYAKVEVNEASRKQFHVTAEGAAFLNANPAAIDDLFSRIAATVAEVPEPIPAPISRAAENLKRVLHLRLSHGPLDQMSVEDIAAALDAVAQIVERR